MLPNGDKANTSQKNLPEGRPEVAPKEAHALAASQTREMPTAGPSRWRQADTPVGPPPSGMRGLGAVTRTVRGDAKGLVH
jgi:hypothetical protein